MNKKNILTVGFCGHLSPNNLIGFIHMRLALLSGSGANIMRHGQFFCPIHIWYRGRISLILMVDTLMMIWGRTTIHISVIRRLLMKNFRFRQCRLVNVHCKVYTLHLLKRFGYVSYYCLTFKGTSFIREPPGGLFYNKVDCYYCLLELKGCC
jgi:hypothetical protein